MKFVFSGGVLVHNMRKLYSTCIGFYNGSYQEDIKFTFLLAIW
jgi:hypothetical protein